MAKVNTVTSKVVKPKVKRKGVGAKTKTSKNYKKLSIGQG